MSGASPQYRRTVTRRGWMLDIALAVGLTALGQLEAWYGVQATHRQGPHWAEALAFGMAAAALALRRVAPLPVLAFVTAVLVAEFAVFGSPEGSAVFFLPMVGGYSVARYERRHPAWWGLLLLLLLGAAWVALDPMSASLRGRLLAMAWTSPWIIAWLVGALVRSQVLNAEQRRRAREQRAAQAVTEERSRIARELHDVVGHSVSVMTVQVAGVRRRLAPEQGLEREALESVEALGREALSEMRRLVGMLRQAGETSDRQPSPGLADVAQLVEKFRTTGLPVGLTVTGPSRPLAPGLELTAFRIVQEGLTNALRHAVSPTRADVTIAFAGRALELAVRDDGGSVVDPAEPGHGLLGMRERVSVYGGDLRAGPGRDGGFELVATLPLEPA